MVKTKAKKEPTKKEIWNKIKKLGLDKKLKLNSRMDKAVLENALSESFYTDATPKGRQYKHRPKPRKPAAPKKIKPVVEVKKEKPPETKPEPEEENVFKSVKESDYVVYEKPEEEQVTTERPVVRPARQPADPEIKDARKVFEQVAKEIEPTNGTTWAKWWVMCRERIIAKPDSEKIQKFMHDWVKKNYDLTI